MPTIRDSKFRTDTKKHIKEKLKIDFTDAQIYDTGLKSLKKLADNAFLLDRYTGSAAETVNGFNK